MSRRALGVVLALLGLGVVGLLITFAATVGGTVPAPDAGSAAPTVTTPQTPVPAPSTPAPAPTATAQPSADPITGEVTVLAAASLADAFVVLADAFERDHPGVRVVLGFGPSSTLATQVGAGAPADVLATADARTMDEALEALLVAGVPGARDADPQVFARNTLALAVPTSDPGDVDELGDLAREDVTFAMCDEVVPCGAAARRVLDRAGLDREPVTFEPDVGAVLTKVLLGEVDAGFVYASDVRPTSRPVLDGALRVVELPADVNTTNQYPVTVLPGAAHPDVAAAFVAHVLSDEGRQMLHDAGFLAP